MYCIEYKINQMQKMLESIQKFMKDSNGTIKLRPIEIKDGKLYISIEDELGKIQTQSIGLGDVTQQGIDNVQFNITSSELIINEKSGRTFKIPIPSDIVTERIFQEGGFELIQNGERVSSFSQVAKTGDYNDLINKPEILTEDWINSQGFVKEEDLQQQLSEEQIRNFISAYNDSPISISFTGDNTKTLTLTKRDGTTLTASFSDIKNDGSTNSNITDGVVNSFEFDKNSGVVTINVFDEDDNTNTSLTVNLDDRWSLLGHKHSIDDVTGLSEALNSKSPNDHTHSEYQSKLPTNENGYIYWNGSEWITKIPETSSGGITEETDPTVPNHVKNISEQDISNWNQKADLNHTHSEFTQINQTLTELTQKLVSNDPNLDTLQEVVDKVKSINNNDITITYLQNPNSQNQIAFVINGEQGDWITLPSGSGTFQWEYNDDLRG